MKTVTPVGKFAALITAVAAITLLFVVVCPLTPTPLAVVSNHASHLPSAGFAVVHAPSASLQFASLHLVGGTTLLQHVQSPHPGYDQLVDLTCARLC